MKEIILVKYGEIILKGHNRPVFENRLLKNIRTAIGAGQVRLNQATVYIQTEDFHGAMEKLRRVFGIVKIVRAAVIPKTLQDLLDMAPAYLAPMLSNCKSFKVETKRADKTFPVQSPQVSAALGEAILRAFPHLRVDVTNPDHQVMVEIRDEGIFLHGKSVDGPGGMPAGSNGSAMLLLSGGIDSPVAGYLMAKRGLGLEAVHFFSHPYTSEAARQKVLELRDILSGWAGQVPIHLVPFTQQQLAMREHCPEQHLTLIMRRMMMAAAEQLALGRGCSALITGESLGQVASQTVWALGVTDSVCQLPVLRPCIGMDKQEIINIAREIGTFETSILPYEDCCTIFTPKRPTIRPKLESILKSESKIPFQQLMETAVKESYVQ